MIKYPITERETEVLKCLSNGLTTEQAAKKLFISRHTAESHRRSLYFKLEAKNAVQLGVVAERQGLLSNSLITG